MDTIEILTSSDAKDINCYLSISVSCPVEKEPLPKHPSIREMHSFDIMYGRKRGDAKMNLRHSLFAIITSTSLFGALDNS